MIGAFNANVPFRSRAGQPVASPLEAVQLSGNGQVGTVLTATAVLGKDPAAGSVVGYQWYLNQTALPAAQNQNLTVLAAHDLAQLWCRVTLTAQEQVWTRDTVPVVAMFAPPTSIGTLPDEILDRGTGAQQIDVSGAFTGAGLSYSVVGGPVEIDPATGMLTIDTNGGWEGGVLTITAANSGGAGTARLQVTLEHPPAVDSTLNLSVAGSGLHLDNPGLPATLGSEGIWFSSFFYYDGTSYPNGRLVGLANPTSGARYFLMRPQQMELRNGGGTIKFDPFGTVTKPGWYLVTGHLWAAGNGDVQGRLYRNDSTSGVFDFKTSVNLSGFSRLGWTMLPDSTPEFGESIVAGLSWGTGNPTAYHAAVFNGGSFADPAAYAFASDPAAQRIGYEPGTQTADGTPFEAADLIHSWSVVGKAAWTATLPPYVASGFARVANVSMKQTVAPRRITVEVDLDVTIWNAPSVNLSKVDVLSRYGYGGLNVTETQITPNGARTTVLLTLNRDVYADELFEIQFQDGWIADQAGNIAIAETFGNLASQTGLTRPSKVRGLSRNGIAFEFADAYEAGHTADHVMWVRDPGSGVQILSKSPGLGLNASGRAVHGTMLNPARDEGANAQGYCALGSEAKDNYNPALSVNFPVTLSGGDSLVATQSNPSPYDLFGGRTGHPVNVVAYQGLLVTDHVPGADEVPPPLIGYDAATRPGWLRVDLPSIVAALPEGYDTTGHDKPALEAALARIERFNPAQTQFSQVEMKREMTPSGFTNQDGYGVNFAGTMGAVLLSLLSQQTGTAERARIVRWLIHHYRQWYGTGRLWVDGGHNQGMWAPMVLADHWVNGGAGIPDMLEVIGGNEQSAFQVEDLEMMQKMTLPHDGADGSPAYNKRTTISSVEGDVVRLADVDTKTGSSLRDAVRARGGLELVRESDGAAAVVTAVDDNAGTFTLAANGHGYRVGDTVYLRPPWPMAVGEYEWSLRVGLARYSPSATTSYRGLNFWSAQVLAVRAFGLMHPAFAAIEGYVARANETGNPSPANDFPPHHGTFVYGAAEGASGTARWDRQFWAAHWPTIKALPQRY